METRSTASRSSSAVASLTFALVKFVAKVVFVGTEARAFEDKVTAAYATKSTSSFFSNSSTILLESTLNTL